MTEYKDIVEALTDSLAENGIRIYMYRGTYLEPKCEVYTTEHDKKITDKTIEKMKTILEFEVGESVLIPKAAKTFLREIILKVVKEMEK